MTPAPEGQHPPESSDEQVPAAADGPQVPVPRVEFLRATRKVMRGSRALITGGDAGGGALARVDGNRERGPHRIAAVLRHHRDLS